VTGTLQITNLGNVLSISSTTLQSVSALILNDLPKLSTLTLPALTNFSKLDFTGLTALKGCTIATGALTRDINEIIVVDTALETMDWLRWPVASQLNIAANTKLKEFKLPYDRISADSSYSISINPVLSNLDFSQLSGIYGSLTVNGNNDNQLNFDKLETIDGYVRLDGGFTNITMPALTGISGALRAESTADILKFCNWLSTQTRLLGHYDCTANNTNSITLSTSSKPSLTTAGPTSSSTNTNSLVENENSNIRKSTLSTPAIIGVAVTMVILISIILTTAALLFFRRRIRNKAQAPMPDNKTHSTSTLGKESDASGIHYELGAEKTAHELPGGGMVRELDGESLHELDVKKHFFRDQKPAPASPIGRFELP
jgi:hypothetical protein